MVLPPIVRLTDIVLTRSEMGRRDRPQLGIRQTQALDDRTWPEIISEASRHLNGDAAQRHGCARHIVNGGYVKIPMVMDRPRCSPGAFAEITKIVSGRGGITTATWSNRVEARVLDCF